MNKYLFNLVVCFSLFFPIQILALQSSPGAVTFSNPTVPNPTVTFNSAGTFILQLSASDGSKTSVSNVTVTVLPSTTTLPPPPPPSSVPVVVIRTGTAIAGNTVTFPVSFQQTGTSTIVAIQFDLVLPSGVSTGTVTPNVVALDAALSAGKTAIGSALPGGIYRTIISGLNTNIIWAGGLVQFTFYLNPTLPAGTLPINVTNVIASDAKGTTVPINGTGGSIAVTANQAPVVSAGPSQIITLPASAQLVGTASDDGAPNPPGTLSYLWTVL